MKVQNFISTTILCLLLSFAQACFAQNGWQAWLKQLKSDAVSQGIAPRFFDNIFNNLKLNKRVLHFDRTQPENRITYTKYRNTRGSDYKIKIGRNELKKHQKTLSKVSSEYKVDMCYIVALWGMETSYGRFRGSHPVIESLTTLAFSSERAAFFRKELLHALHMLDGGHVKRSDFKGEWAGGSGHPQFLPSSWHNFAVDFNKDGKKDIWHTKDDVFASIANYLRSNGWEFGQPSGIKVNIPENFDSELIGYDTEMPMEEWFKLGVRAQPGEIIPDRKTKATLLKPHGGPAMLIFKNFRVLLTYNRSTFYAGTVSYMAEQICH